ncbi:MAG TPA: hypothetical protein VEN30_01830 [Paraburkholderia sp.]|nr:hypothetical protein [Paraburkholderia sp.]
MLFGASRTRPTCHPESDEVAESDRINGQVSVRDRLRPKEFPGSASDRSVLLAGWKACSSNLNETGSLRSNNQVEITNLLEAIQQNIQLRKKLHETRQEVEVLVEALEYARDICPLAHAPRSS